MPRSTHFLVGHFRISPEMKHENLDEKVAKRNSIPARIVFWLIVIGLLYAFYKALSMHAGH